LGGDLLKLKPDFYFRDIYAISPDFFLEKGIKTVICDIDNTLVTYQDPYPTPKVREWFSRMEQAGIQLLLLSNNHEDRVGRFAKSAGLPYFCDAGKPGIKILKKALSEKGAKVQESAVLGDQLFTDILSGSRSGLTTVLVPPILDRTDFFHKAKRYGERPIMKSFFKNRMDGEELYQHWLMKTGLTKEKKEKEGY
jgi:hypothetical protein